MKFIEYFNTSIDSGIWKEKQDLNRATTIYSVYDRFKETGRFDAFKCNWKEGMPFKPHIFWDSDIAKWLESVAYLTKTKREKDTSPNQAHRTENLNGRRRQTQFHSVQV